MKNPLPKAMWFVPVASEPVRRAGLPLPIVRVFNRKARGGNVREDKPLYVFTAGEWSLAFWWNGLALTTALTDADWAKLVEAKPVQGPDAIEFTKKFVKTIGGFGDNLREEVLRHMVFPYNK